MSDSRTRRGRALAFGGMILGLAAGLAVGGCRSDDPLPCGTPAEGCPMPSTEAFVDPVVPAGRAEGPTFVEIVDVVAQGDQIYACTGTQGLTIWDASADPPTLLSERTGPTAEGLADSRFPRCQHLGIDPDAARVVITNRGDEVQPQPWLWVYDVSDPTNPESIGGWSDSLASIEGVALRGDRIYAALHGSGVATLQLTAAGAISVLGIYADEQSDAWVPVLHDERLFVAEGASGLRIYDVSGDTPALLSTLALPGSSRDLVLDGDRAYIADSSGLAVVDVADPSAPQLLSQTDSQGTSLEVALGPDQTVVMAEWDELRGYDVSDPANVRPAFAQIVPSDEAQSRVLAVDVDRQRGTIYAGEWRGLQALDYTGPGRGPELSVSPSTLQFGELAAGESQARVVVVRNDGDRPLTVSDVVGGPGLAAEPECFAVPAGESMALEVTLTSDGTQSDTGLKLCSDDLDEAEVTLPVTANVPGVSVGDPVPDFTLLDTQGNTWSPEQLRGNVAVLAYFATF